jgi:hypothetical protein
MGQLHSTAVQPHREGRHHRQVREVKVHGPAQHSQAVTAQVASILRAKSLKTTFSLFIASTVENEAVSRARFQALWVFHFLTL